MMPGGCSCERLYLHVRVQGVQRNQVAFSLCRRPPCQIDVTSRRPVHVLVCDHVRGACQQMLLRLGALTGDRGDST